MKKPYITRKNLIFLAITLLYALLFVFVGLCISATADSAISRNNIFLKMLLSLGIDQITIEGSGAVTNLALTGLYIVLLVFSLIYIHRFRVTNKMKWYDIRILLFDLLAIALSGGLCVGVTYLFSMGNFNLANMMFTLIGHTFLITTITALFVGSIVAAVAMLYVNFKKIDKPYAFFSDDAYDELGEEKETESDVSKSFDTKEEGTELAGVGGVGGAGGTSELNSVNGSKELDEREIVFPGLSKIDANYDGYSIETFETDDLTLTELVDRFRNYLAKEEKLYYDENTLRIFIAGLNATRLSILEGLSGTGKSSLPRYFAKFVNASVTFLPVQVTWRDKTSILGYFNDFSKIYNETDFLLRLYEASYNPDRIHIFVLDEMNISRIEYYFADFLSVLEYPSDEWKIRIMQLPYGFVPPARLDEGYIQIPTNSFFVGTANKDDSTFSIADKVYDRATVIAFDNRNEPFEVKGKTKPIQLSYSKLDSLFKGAMANSSNQMTKGDFEKLYKITSYIYDQFEVAFGNRVLNQIENLVPVFVASGGKKEDALDFILARKVIVKLEGRFEEFVKPALKKVIALLDETYGSNEFPLSRKELNSLIRKL